MKIVKRATKSTMKKAVLKAGKKIQEKKKVKKVTDQFRRLGDKGLKYDAEFEKMRDAFLEYNIKTGGQLIISYSDNKGASQIACCATSGFVASTITNLLSAMK